MKIIAEEIRRLSIVEIDELILKLTKELTQIKLRIKLGQDNKTHKIKYIKRTIGRLKTIKTQKMEQKEKISAQESKESGVKT